MNTLACRRCKEEKPQEAFYPSYTKGPRGNHWCKPCAASYAQSWRAKNRGRYSGIKRARYTRLVEQVYEGYGDLCSCCGESNPLFLSIDHVFNNGAVHRQQLNNGRRGPNGERLYREVIARGFPRDYQLLCFNCNLGRSRNKGVCPHQEGTPSI